MDGMHQPRVRTKNTYCCTQTKTARDSKQLTHVEKYLKYLFRGLQHFRLRYIVEYYSNKPSTAHRRPDMGDTVDTTTMGKQWGNHILDILRGMTLLGSTLNEGAAWSAGEIRPARVKRKRFRFAFFCSSLLSF